MIATARNARPFFLAVTLFLMFTATASAQQTSTVRGYTLTFTGVVYDWTANTSTWNYTLTWHGRITKDDHELSHLVIGICTGNVTSASPSVFELNGPPAGDPTTGVIGIKWSGAIAPLPSVSSFSFTLDGTYAPMSGVRWAPKAATDADGATIDGPSCSIATPHLKVTKTCVPDAFVGDTINWVLEVENTGNVALDNVTIDDTLVGIHETIASFGVGAKRTMYPTMKATETGDLPNTVTASGTYYGNLVGPESASCSTHVWAPTVTKTTDGTSYKRNFNWTVAKAVHPNQPAVVELAHGETKDVAFVISASNVSVDSNFAANGSITVVNPAPIALSVAAITDDLGGSSIPVVCPAAFPMSVPANSAVTCTWAASLSNATTRVNHATLTLTNGTSIGPAAATVSFGDPTTIVDPSLTVTDIVSLCPAGFSCTATPNSFNFTGPGSQNMVVSVTNVDADCETFFSLANSVTGLETDGRSTSAAATYADGVKSAVCEFGCTLTIGFWKNHAGFSGKNADVVTPLLPQNLGTAGGAKTVKIATREQAVSALKMELGAPSNGITKLYAQLLAAKFNIARGASSGAVSGTIGSADAYLANKNQNDWTAASQSQRKDIISWMSLLDAYNNGLIGPGHCN